MSVRHYDWLAHHARRAPASLAVVDLRSERRLTYRQFDHRSARLAEFLATAVAVTKGDRVAVLAHNSTDVLEIQFACAKIGAIFELPAVAEVAVIGVPDPRWDEVGCAVVVLKAVVSPGEALDADGIIAHCQGRLARFKIPKTVVFMDELPHNATGKVLKRVLRDRIIE